MPDASSSSSSSSERSEYCPTPLGVFFFFFLSLGLIRFLSTILLQMASLSFKPCVSSSTLIWLTKMVSVGLYLPHAAHHYKGRGRWFEPAYVDMVLRVAPHYNKRSLILYNGVTLNIMSIKVSLTSCAPRVLSKLHTTHQHQLHTTP